MVLSKTHTHTQKALSHRISEQIENFQINKVQQNRQIANYTVRLDSKRHGNKLHMIAALKVQKKKISQMILQGEEETL